MIITARGSVADCTPSAAAVILLGADAQMLDSNLCAAPRRRLVVLLTPDAMSWCALHGCHVCSAAGACPTTASGQANRSVLDQTEPDY